MSPMLFPGTTHTLLLNSVCDTSQLPTFSHLQKNCIQNILPQCRCRMTTGKYAKVIMIKVNLIYLNAATSSLSSMLHENVAIELVHLHVFMRYRVITYSILNMYIFTSHLFYIVKRPDIRMSSKLKYMLQMSQLLKEKCVTHLLLECNDCYRA